MNRQSVIPSITETVSIRWESFSRKTPLSSTLTELCKGTPSHAFLVNPASQNTYLYLTRYIADLLTKWLSRPEPAIQILDWGAGKGHVTHLLSELKFDVTSCDVAKTSGDSTFGQAAPIVDGTRIDVIPLRHDCLLPFDDDSFDAVVSMGVLEHVPREQESLLELHRVLRPGGLLFCFYLPQKFSWTQKLKHLRGDRYHDRLYTKRKVIDLLADAGFDPIDIWHRALFPKNTATYRDYRKAEALDQWLCAHTPLRHLATNIECVARKNGQPR